MSANNPAGPLALFPLSKELFAVQRFLPSSHFYAQLAEVTRGVTQANVAYAQALLRANASLLAAFLEPAGAAAPDRPSDAAHQPDCEMP